MQVMPFFEFCEKVLGLKLTTGQRVIAKVAFGNYDPIDLTGEEQDLALRMFGGVEKVSPSAKRYIVMRLGRGSGKTTMCSAFAVYTAVVHDIRKVGPGDTPFVIVVAPDRPTAQLSIRMAREMIRSQPALERLVTSDTADSIQLRRPDGRSVKIEAFAATRGGSSMRGRTIMAFIMDEAEFFLSNDGSNGRDYSVNDKDIFQALKPRLLRNGKGMLISTPWPVETLMGTMFDESWGKCEKDVAIKAPTILVRGDDPDIVAMVEEELAKDPENARRELFCELDGLSGGEFFDVNALKSSIHKVELEDFPIGPHPEWPVAVGCDLGFTGDSSAICVVQFDGKNYRQVHLEEFRPKPGKPLKPSEVIGKFAEIAKRYGAQGVVADGYYREALREQLESYNLVVFNAPEGTKGKADVFQRSRAVLHEGHCLIPDVPICRRMIAQAKMVVSRPAPGGTTTIRIPRKIGMGHGDLVSAWTLAIHRLAFAELEHKIPTYEPGSTEWIDESARRIVDFQKKQQDQYLKNLEKQVRKGLDARKLRQVFEGRH